MRPEPPSTLKEWRKARANGWRPAPVANLPRECHRAPEEWREAREGRESNLADLVADQMGWGPVDRIVRPVPHVELPSSVRRTLNAVQFQKRGGNDPGGWNIAHVPNSRKDNPQRAYRRYKNMAGGDRDTLTVARLSTWFCALLGETTIDIDPWHLVTRADSKMTVPISDGAGQQYEWQVGWVKELFGQRRVSYTEAGERHYPQTYFNVALVKHPKVGWPEKIRLDDVTRRTYAESLVDLGQRWARPQLWPEFDVHTEPGAPQPANVPADSAAPLACAFHWPNGHRPSPIHRIFLHRVPSVPWTDPERNDSPWGPPPKAGDGWDGFRQPLCLGHFGEHFEAIERSWKNIILRADDGGIPLVEKKSAEELLAPDEYQEWTPDDYDDPADHVGNDPLDPGQVATRKPPMRNVRIAPPEDSPEFDTAELIEVAAALGIWEILDDEGRMMLAFHADGMTRKDVAKILHKSERTIYNRRKAGTLRQMILEKTLRKLPI